MQQSGILALQESAEQFISDIFEKGWSCALHAGRSTLMVKDLRLAMFIMGYTPTLNHRGGVYLPDLGLTENLSRRYNSNFKYRFN